MGNCVAIYAFAERLERVQLSQHALQVLDASWDQLQASDFRHLSAATLYKMLKT